jgi:DNA-binding transcriptional MerR regulator
MLHSTIRANYSISELAREFGVTIRTIRYYEDQGLLKPRREGQNRSFSSRDRARLRLALRAKRLGFSLADIGELFKLFDAASERNASSREFLDKLDHHRKLLERQREDVESMLAEIQFFQNQHRKLPSNSPTSVGNTPAHEQK